MKYQTCSIDMLQASSGVALPYALDLPLTGSQLAAWPLDLLCNHRLMLIPERFITPFSPYCSFPPCLAWMITRLWSYNERTKRPIASCWSKAF